MHIISQVPLCAQHNRVSMMSIQKHTQAYADGTITQLCRIVPEGLDSVTVEQIKTFFKRCRDYENAYREGVTGREVEEDVILYKSHTCRCVYSEHS